jgi:hypothetical protein
VSQPVRLKRCEYGLGESLSPQLTARRVAPPALRMRFSASAVASSAAGTTGLAFPNYFVNWDAGRPADPDTPAYAKTLLDQLAWWATALRKARADTPYPD